MKVKGIIGFLEKKKAANGCFWRALKDSNLRPTGS